MASTEKPIVHHADSARGSGDDTFGPAVTPRHAGTGKKKRRSRSTPVDEALLVRVVLASYRHLGMSTYRSYRAVSRELGISVHNVIKYRDIAFKRGMFSVLVSLPQELADVVRLEDALKQAYPQLREVLLVPGLPEMLDDPDPPRRRSIHIHAIRAMARRLADYLDALVSEAARRQVAATKARVEVKPFLLGVAWGHTMHLVAEHLLNTLRNVVGRPLVQVVPIVGITTVLNPEPVEANVIAMDIARAYRGVSAQLPVPAFVRQIELSVATQSEAIQQMLKRLPDCDVVITSMGPIPENPLGAMEIALSNDAVMNERLFKDALTEGAIGEICYWQFRRDGSPVRTEYTAIGLGFEGLKKIASDPKRKAILICGGEQRRIEPLRAALNAGLASVLVSDTVTAKALLGEI